jgi:hypothetical protein
MVGQAREGQGDATDTPMTDDWTIAFDDMLIERFPRCIECAAPAWSFATVRVDQVILSLSRCARCFKADPQAATLIARLSQREEAAQQRKD